jgi:hypothetical protein
MPIGRKLRPATSCVVNAAASEKTTTFPLPRVVNAPCAKPPIGLRSAPFSFQAELG